MPDERLFEASVNASVEACAAVLRQIVLDPDIRLAFGDVDFTEQERRRYEVQIRLTRATSTVPIGRLVLIRLTMDMTLIQVEEAKYSPVARITEDGPQAVEELSPELRAASDAAVRSVRDAVLQRLHALHLLAGESRWENGLALPSLGEHVKQARNFKGWSLAATSALLGGEIDPVRLRDIEEGSASADPRLWGRLWLLLGLPLYELYQGVGLPVPSDLPSGIAGEIWSLVRTQPSEVQRLVLTFAAYAPALVGSVLSAPLGGPLISANAASNGAVDVPLIAEREAREP
jgi:hypothetical protein